MVDYELPDPWAERRQGGDCFGRQLRVLAEIEQVHILPRRHVLAEARGQLGCTRAAGVDIIAEVPVNIHDGVIHVRRVRKEAGWQDLNIGPGCEVADELVAGQLEEPQGFPFTAQGMDRTPRMSEAPRLYVNQAGQADQLLQQGMVQHYAGS